MVNEKPLPQSEQAARLLLFVSRLLLLLRRLDVVRLHIHVVAFVVLVVVPHPSHLELQTILVAPLGDNVQPVVRTEERVQPAPIRRIGVEHISGGVLVEDAGAGPLLRRELLPRVVVVNLGLPRFFLALLNVIVEVEVRPVG